MTDLYNLPSSDYNDITSGYNGYFATPGYDLVTGLGTGDADRDQDGVIVLDELYDYIYDHVRTATPNQSPGKWYYDFQGDIVIARRMIRR